MLENAMNDAEGACTQQAGKQRAFVVCAEVGRM